MKTARARAKPPRLAVAEVKALVRFRDGYCCVECGMSAREHVQKHGKTLEVHRLIPGSRYTVRGCVALCGNCHFGKPRSPRQIGACRGLVRLRAGIAEALQALADENETTLTEEANLAIREKLERADRWPPKPRK